MLKFTSASCFEHVSVRVRKATGWRYGFKREDHCVLTQGDSRLNT